MKKIIGTLFVAVIVLTACAMTAFAQPGGGPGGRGPGGPGGRGGFGPGGPGGGGITFLIRNEEVKKELGLSEEQVAKLEKISEESRQQRPGGPGGPRAGAGGDRPAPPTAEEMKKFREEFEKQVTETQAKVDQVLTPEQQEKLSVLRFQTTGGLDSPFLNERSLAALKLSDEQKKQLKVISEEREAEGNAAFEKMRKIDWRSLPQEDREKLGKELQTENEARVKKYGDKIKTILTPEQKDKAEKLSAGAKDVREKLGIPDFGVGGQPGGRRGGEGDRPNLEGWSPGQGTGDRGNRDRQQRRTFPQSE